MIDQHTIERIQDTANIVDVVSEFVTLRRRGVNYVGLCPFHSDKTPSFYVSPAKNICKCFACGEGGTPVHFIMKHEQIGYHDALRFLAKKYNIEIEERELTDREKQLRSDRESMLIVNTWAQQYFSRVLFDSEEGQNIGLRYFTERGFRKDIIQKFQLGYAHDQYDALYQAAIKNGYKKDYLEKTGLVIAYENNKVNDRFRGRVIFPVHTLSGKVVAFGGRTLKKDAKTAKYVNSPESEIYHKSNELYGIFFAKQPIVKADRCYLVEGYTDVISMHQAGIENVVSSSGTALTPGQIRLIHRFTNNITVLYDGDAAGIKAALRGIDMLLEEGMNIKVVLLPNGEDPDSFARKNNATTFHEFIAKNETDFIRFKTKLLLDEAGNDPIKRSSLISDIIRSVAVIPDDIARAVYIQECSSMMEVDEKLVLTEVNKLRLKKAEKGPTIAVAQNTQQAPPPPPPPDYQGFQESQAAPNEGHPYAPENMPPPPPEYEGVPEAILGSGSDAIKEFGKAGLGSPYEAYELALLWYVVRHGEYVLFESEPEEGEEATKVKVAEYILSELEQDNISFQTPLYKQMLTEAAARCQEEGFVASRFFLSHPDQTISQLAVNLYGDKYQLSKYHTKNREVESDEERLSELVLKDIFALKDAYITLEIKKIHTKIKALQLEEKMEEIMELAKKLTELNEIKNILCRELGERIVLKL